MIIFLTLLTILLTGLLSVAVFYLVKFVKIIFILEDDFSDAIEGLNSIELNLEKILNMQLFFENKEVKMVVQDVLSNVKKDKMLVTKLIHKFVQRSKNKYTVVIEEDDPFMKRIIEMQLKEKMLQNNLEN